MTATRATEEDRSGTVLAGKYELQKQLGAGGMGAVYSANNSWTGRRVAVKVLLPELAESAEVTARFLREAKSSSLVEHPNIVQVLDLGRDADGTLFLVQEFLDGRDLHSVLEERGCLPLQEALELVVPIIDALAALHERNLVHRDVKPSNVFLARSARGAVVPKLIDFGIAKSVDTKLDADVMKVTRTGSLVGTPLYMSPEQARGDREVGPECDAWALAVMLYETLCGAPPFEGENYNQLLVAILTTTPKRVDARVHGVPADLAAVLERALTQKREVRFSDAGELLGALLACEGLKSLPFFPALAAAHTHAHKAPLLDTDSRSQTWVGNAPPAAALDATVNAHPSAPRPSTLGGSGVAAPKREPTQSAPPSRAWLFGVAVLLLAGGGFAALRARSGSATPPTVTPAPPPTVTPAPPPALAAPLVLELAVEPATATIELDGAQLGIGAVTRALPRDGMPHALRVTAPGYAPLAMTFREDPPRRLSLQPLPRASTPPPPPAATGAPRPPPVTAQRPPGTPPPPAAPAPPPGGRRSGVTYGRDYE